MSRRISPDQIPTDESEFRRLSAGPPYSLLAEKAVLGSMISRPDEIIDQAMDSLTESSFFSPPHKDIFRTLIAMHNAKEPIDISTFLLKLDHLGLAEKVGSPGYITDLLIDNACWYNAGSYIKVVREKSILRRLYDLSAIIGAAVQESSAEEALEAAAAGLSAIVEDDSGDRGGKSWAQHTFETIDYVNSPVESRVGIKTGFEKFDDKTGGFQGGELIIIAARPGMGKTSLLQSWLNNMAYRGNPCGLINLEMLPRQTLMKTLAMQANLSLHKMRTQMLSNQERMDLETHGNMIASWPVQISDQPNVNLAKIRLMARRWRRNFGIKILFLDYIQLVKDDSNAVKNEKKFEEIARVTRATKLLAIELNIPIVLCAQLNRDATKGQERPALHHLGGSSSLEQDADIIVFPHREANATAFNGCMPYTLITAKHRLGPAEDIGMIFRAYSNKFEEAP